MNQLKPYRVVAVGETNWLRFNYDTQPVAHHTKGMGILAFPKCIGRLLDHNIADDFDQYTDRWDLQPPKNLLLVNEAMGIFGGKLLATKLHRDDEVDDFRTPVHGILFIKDVWDGYRTISCGIIEGEGKPNITLEDFVPHIATLEESLRILGNEFAKNSFIRGIVPGIPQPSKRKCRRRRDPLLRELKRHD